MQKLYELKHNLAEQSNTVKRKVKKLEKKLPLLIVIIFLMFVTLIVIKVQKDYQQADVELDRQKQKTQQNQESIESINQKYQDLLKLQQEQKTEYDQKLEEVKTIRVNKRKKEEAIRLVVVQPPRPVTVQRVGPTLAGARLDPAVAQSIMLQYWGEDQWSWMDELIRRESGYVNQWNKSGSGACGLAQVLPCSKLGPLGINTPLDQQIHWMCQYVKNRYGSPYLAIVHHNRVNWY